jgi:tetratricopeptide (TPR) repeat protein
VAPDVGWRVINMGAPGWGSTRLRILSEQLLFLDSDLVLITSGNNEFIEASFAEEVMKFRGNPMRWWWTVRRDSHLLTFMAETLAPVAQDHSTEFREKRIRSVREQSRERAREVHRENLASIAQAFEKAGTRVYLSTVPVNLRACPPLGTDAPGDALGPKDPAAVRDYRRARSLFEANDFAGAAQLFEELIARHPKSAWLRYLYARVLEALDRFEDAREAYLQALDLDRVPLRTSRLFNANATRLADEMDVGFVDLAKAMEAENEVGIPGNDLFLDNCHPNRAGARVLALAIARQMERDDLFDSRARWEEIFVRATRRYQAAVELSVEDRMQALLYLLDYYARVNPQPQRADEIEQRIRALDPDFSFPQRRQLRMR